MTIFNVALRCVDLLRLLVDLDVEDVSYIDEVERITAAAEELLDDIVAGDGGRIGEAERLQLKLKALGGTCG